MKKYTLAALGLLLSASTLRAQIDVEQALSIGRNAIYFNDYIVSMGYFNQIIGLRPWMAEPYFYRAVAKINLDDYAGAEADASLALERNPIFPRAYLLRGYRSLLAETSTLQQSRTSVVVSSSPREMWDFSTTCP